MFLVLVISCLIGLSTPMQVVLVGGSCKIPRLQQLLREAFPCSTLHLSVPPDEVITKGCALQAGLMAAMPGKRVEEGGRLSRVVSCTREDLWLNVGSSPSLPPSPPPPPPSPSFSVQTVKLFSCCPNTHPSPASDPPNLQ